MTLNLVVPVAGWFQFLDSGSKLRSEIIGVAGLLISPGIWFGQGDQRTSKYCNEYGKPEHDDREVIRQNASYFNCDWDILK